MRKCTKLVILDYDLTLVENIYDFYDSFNDLLKKYGGEAISFREFYDKFARDELKDCIPESVDVKEFWRELRSNVCTSKAQYYADWHVKQFLYVVKLMNAKSAIVSGKSCYKQHIVRELERGGLADYIDEVYTFFDLDLLRGAERELFDKSWILRHVVDKHGVEPREAVYVGDYYMDYVSSLRAGIEFIALARAEQRYKAFREMGAKFIARDFAEAMLYLMDLANC